MDDSIKRRADNAIYEREDGDRVRACEVIAFAKGYEKGAIEQDCISYLRGRNGALKEMAGVIEQMKTNVTKWLCNNCPLGDCYNDPSTCEIKQSLLTVMEE